jgi:hypothetical protein
MAALLVALLTVLTLSALAPPASAASTDASHAARQSSSSVSSQGSDPTTPADAVVDVSSPEPAVKQPARVTGLVVLGGTGLIAAAAFLTRRRRLSGTQPHSSARSRRSKT